MGIFTTCVIIGQSPQFHGIMKHFETIANLTNYEGYIIQLEEGFEGGADKFNLFGLMQMSYMATAIFTIFFAPDIINKYNDTIPHLC